MDGDSAVALQEMPVCINCRILVLRSLQLLKMELEQLRESQSIPNMETPYILPEEPRQCNSLQQLQFLPLSWR